MGKNKKNSFLKSEKKHQHWRIRGEEEIVKFSKKGKLHIDSTAANLKKEKFFLFNW